jgi:hypothetical protein
MVDGVPDEQVLSGNEAEAAEIERQRIFAGPVAMDGIIREAERVHRATRRSNPSVR